LAYISDRQPAIAEECVCLTMPHCWKRHPPSPTPHFHSRTPTPGDPVKHTVDSHCDVWPKGAGQYQRCKLPHSVARKACLHIFSQKKPTTPRGIHLLPPQMSRHIWTRIEPRRERLVGKPPVSFCS